MTREEARQHVEKVRRERFWLDDVSRTPGENPLMAMLRRALNQLATLQVDHEIEIPLEPYACDF